MLLQSCYLSHKGLIRNNNEDSLLLNDLLITEASMETPQCVSSSEDKQLYAVADGLGGHAKGEVASSVVLAVLKEQYHTAEMKDDIQSLLQDAREQLNALVRRDRTKFSLGTTITGMLIVNARAVIFNCGDSRIYRVEGNALTRMTKDHSLVQELLDRRLITEDEMRTHLQKNIITSSLIGDLRHTPPGIELREISLAPGDTFLLCSDGLWESMGKEDMEACLSKRSMSESISCLLANALANGGKDNVSIILLSVQEV